MVKNLLIIGLILLAPALSGAQPHESLKTQAEGYALPAKPQKGYGMVYIVRPSDVGLFTEFYVYLDKKLGKNRIGRTKGREYLYFKENAILKPQPRGGMTGIERT